MSFTDYLRQRTQRGVTPEGWHTLVYTDSISKPASEVFSEVLDMIEIVYTRDLLQDIWVQVTGEMLLEPYHIYHIKQHLPAPIPLSLRWFRSHF